MGLDSLPHALVQVILGQLDLRSLCSVAATSRSLRSCSSSILSQLDSVCVEDVPLLGSDLTLYLAANDKIQNLALDCQKLADADIHLLLKLHLQKLCLWRCCNFSHKIFSEIGLRCTKLRSLSLELGVYNDPRTEIQIYRAAFEQMLKSLSQLESLYVSVETEHFAGCLLSVLPHGISSPLKALTVEGMRECYARQLVDVKGVGVSEPLPRVRVVGLQNLQQLCLLLNRITDPLISLIAKNLECLLHLELEDNPFERQSEEDHDLSNVGFQKIAAYRHLKRLSLVRSKLPLGRRRAVSFKKVNDLGFLLLAQSCKGLESIRLGGFTQVTDTGLNGLLQACSNLRAFELIRMTQMSDLTFQDLSVTAGTLKAVSLPAANQITSDAVSQLACCENLTYLNLAFCRSVGDQGLEALSYLRKLTILDLNGADVTDVGLFSLAKCSAPLASLSLRGCKRVTGMGIIVLVHGPLSATLQALDLSCLPAVTDSTVYELILSGMQLVDLRLRDCHALTKSCVSSLANMQYNGKCCGGSLQVLDLWHNPYISIDSLEWFKRPYFPRLRWLGLGMHVEKYALVRLERPSLEVSWEGCDPDFGFDFLSREHQRAHGGFGFWME